MTHPTANTKLASAEFKPRETHQLHALLHSLVSSGRQFSAAPVHDDAGADGRPGWIVTWPAGARS